MPTDVASQCRGAVLEADQLADCRQRRTGLGPRRRLGRGRAAHRNASEAQGRATARPSCRTTKSSRRHADSISAIMMIRAYRMRGHLHADLDPLGIAEAERGLHELSPADLRLHRGRLRPPDLHRLLSRARIRHHPRDARNPQAHLLLDGRRRVHAHLRSRGQGLDPGAHRGPGQGDRLHRERQEGDPEQAGRGRRLREVPRRQVYRHQALRARRRRIADPGARTDHQARRRAGGEGHRPRHGPSRPAQRADPGDGQAAPRAVPRVQGRRLLPRGRRRLGRRQIPSRRLVRPRIRRQQGAPVADRQPVPSRDRQSGGAWARRAPSRTSSPVGVRSETFR